MSPSLLTRINWELISCKFFCYRFICCIITPYHVGVSALFCKLNLYALSNIGNVIKSILGAGWKTDRTCAWRDEKHNERCFENLKGRYHKGNLGTGGRILLQ